MTMTMIPRPRSATRQPMVRYECRVVRSVQQDQPELMRPLQLLAEHTSNFIDYRKVGKLGVTIMMIEPMLRHILLKNKRGIIPRSDLQDFEAELRDNLEHAQYSDYDIPLDPVSPLTLYGRGKNRLGLQLSQHDYRLTGDRAVVESYIRDNYEQNSGAPVSKRFIDKNSARLMPHITVGDVKYENMEPDQVVHFQNDPAGFLVREAYNTMFANREEYGPSYEVTDIIFPEEVSLNGLKVFCQQKQ